MEENATTNRKRQHDCDKDTDEILSKRRKDGLDMSQVKEISIEFNGRRSVIWNAKIAEYEAMLAYFRVPGR